MAPTCYWVFRDSVPGREISWEEVVACVPARPTHSYDDPEHFTTFVAVMKRRNVGGNALKRLPVI